MAHAIRSVLSVPHLSTPWRPGWFYHFASEEILGGLAALSAAETERRVDIPDRVIIPWVEGWRDPYRLNEAVAGAIQKLG
jgi:hypothetical protein